MEFLFFIGGMILGIIFTIVYKQYDKIYGILQVDHIHEQCRVVVSNDELLDRKNKKVSLKIDHNANFSREEQGL